MNPGPPAERADFGDRGDPDPSDGSDPRPLPRWIAHGTSRGGDRPAGRRILLAAKIVLFLGILASLNYTVAWLADLVAFQMWPEYLDTAALLLLAAFLSYVLLLAIPFLPGIEVGLLLMAVLGIKGIVLVYLCTVVSLSISFLFGRLFPPRYLARTLGWFHLFRARDLVKFLEPLRPEERLRFLLQRAPSRIVPFLLRRRYLVVGILFNLPGNALIGGGGGIGLVAGMSRLFPYPKYALLVSAAILPGPLFFLARNAWQ